MEIEYVLNTWKEQNSFYLTPLIVVEKYNFRYEINFAFLCFFVGVKL